MRLAPRNAEKRSTAKWRAANTRARRKEVPRYTTLGKTCTRAVLGTGGNGSKHGPESFSNTLDPMDPSMNRMRLPRDIGPCRVGAACSTYCITFV